MSRRTINMSELVEVLYQHCQGFSQRKISRSLGLSRNTVRSVINKATALGYQGHQTSIESIDAIAKQIWAPSALTD